MSNLPADLKYTADHEWLKLSEDGQSATIGITDYAQSSLGDVTFVELPAVGTNAVKGESFGVVESVKAASDLYLPVSGEVIEINEDLESSPDLVNNAPYEGAWMIKIKLSDPAELSDLLSADDYAKLI